MSGILTTFFFAALWRRSGVLTDVEFIELRYSGKPAAALRATRGLYQGVIINTIIMGWVNLAIAKILGLTLGIPKWEAIGICLVLTAIYVSIGGMWSVLVTDVLQFAVKMTMTIVLAVAAVAAVGGVAALREKIGALDAAHHITQGGLLAFFPPLHGAAWMPLESFLVFIAVSWWASSYPGAEPGGGSYVAQRIFASKDEKNSIFATLFFNVAHYALRPWPWILVALSALVLYPAGVKNAAGHVDPELLYVQTMIDHLPIALRGLMMAGFLAAYMSTIGTHLNLGASYMTNDLYRRFLASGRRGRTLRMGLARGDGPGDDPRRDRDRLHGFGQRRVDVLDHIYGRRRPRDDSALVLVAASTPGVRSRRSYRPGSRRRRSSCSVRSTDRIKSRSVCS